MRVDLGLHHTGFVCPLSFQVALRAQSGWLWLKFQGIREDDGEHCALREDEPGLAGVEQQHSAQRKRGCNAQPSGEQSCSTSAQRGWLVPLVFNHETTEGVLL